MKREQSRWVLVGLVLLSLLGAVPALAQQLPSCTAARFSDYRDLGCRTRPLWRDLKCPPCPPNGMPRWWVSQPYQSVWVADEPLSYPLSHGERMSFRWTHRQRYTAPFVYSFFHIYTGLTNAMGRDGAAYREMRTFGATNAAWQQSWLSDILFWDYTWETDNNRAAKALFNQPYEAFWFRADGGVVYLQPPFSNSDNGMRVRVEPLGSLSRPLVTTPAIAADGLYWGGSQTNGLRVVYPDGGVDVYGVTFFVAGLSPTNSPAHNSTARALLTQRIDPQGRVTRIGYSNVIIGVQNVYRPHYVVDPGGRTNTIRYVANEFWKVSEIEDPYGRKARAEYGSGYGPSRLIDAQNLTNTFAYTTTSGWLSSYTTPYGTTSFEYYDQIDQNFTEKFYEKRAVRVTEADGSKQLFLYHHKTDTVTPAVVTNVPSVTGWAFDNGNFLGDHPELYHRNSFHWDTRQYTALTNLTGDYFPLSTQLAGIAGNTNAHRLAHLQHWLLGNDTISALDLLSAEREPALDAAGTVEGAWTWYDYAGKSAPNREPTTEPLLGCVARLLPDGSTWFQATDFYNASGQPLWQRESYTLSSGNVGFRTNWFTYAFNGLDLLVTSNSLGQFVKLGYNTNHQVTAATNAFNQVTELSYNPGTPQLSGVSLVGGQTASVTYYSSNAASMNGGFPKTIQWNPGPTWNFGYDKGLVKYATNDLGLWLGFTWDDLLRPTSTTFPDGSYTSNRYDKLDLVASKDRLGHWTYAQYDALQRPTVLTNANNAVTLLDWCGCGALNSVTDALTNTTWFYYNNQGLLTNQVFADNRSVKYFFDSANRLTNVLDGSRSLKLGYNNQGLVTSVSNAYGQLERVVYDAADRPQEITDANGVTVTNTFDLLNRLTTRVWPDNFGETYGWSTNGLSAFTNRNQQVTRYLRDPAGRLLAVTNANLEVTRIQLNSLGQVTDLWDGRTNHTQWVFDEYGLRRSKTDALNRETTWDYNPNGWLTNRVTPQFGNTTYTYDPVGNLTNIVYPSSSLAYAFDALNRLTNMSDAVGVTKFTHTTTGQLASEDGPWTDDTVTLSYTEGLRTAMNLGSSWSQSYGYDSAWRMTGVSSPAGTFGYSYHATRVTQLTGLTLPNFATITNHFDALGRLDHTALKNRWGHVLDGTAYTHDLLGLRTNLARDFGWTDSAVAIGYDNIAQLTSWSVTETGGTPRLNEHMGWSYDAANNFLRRTNNALVLTFNNNAVNQITNTTRSGALIVSGNTPAPATNVTVNGQGAARYGDFTFASSNGFTLNDGANSFTIVAKNAYGLTVTNSQNVNLPLTVTFTNDLNGNLISDGVRWHEYDAENQLTAVTLSNAWRTEFVYDGLGRRRIFKEYGWSSGWTLTNTTRQVFDQLLPIQERDGNNNVRVTYTRGLDFSGSLDGMGGIGGLLARTDANGSAFYHTDGSGNVTALTDENGDMVGRYLYDPFGKLVGKWGPLADANLLRFSSMPTYEREDLIGYYGRFRKISVPIWTSPDPLGEEGGINLHQFVFNDPINLVDDWGMNARPPQNSGRNSIRGVVSNPAINREINREMRERGLTRGQLEREWARRDAEIDRNTRANRDRYFPNPPATGDLNIPQLRPLIPRPQPQPKPKPCPPGAISSNVSRNAVPEISYDRPSDFRNGVRDDVWKAAIERATGRVRDPLTGKFIGENDPWQMGHRPGFEFRKHQESAQQRGISREQFLNEHNNPGHYRPELPASNQSHRGENRSDLYFGP